jgi:hypothetical protein
MLPLANLLRTVLLVALGFVVYGGCAFLLSLVASRIMRPFVKASPPIIIGMVILCFVVCITVAVKTTSLAFPLRFDVAQRTSGTVLRTTLGTVCVIILAALLFALKLKNLATYALLELMVAITIAARTMNGLADSISPLDLTLILASAYVMIRSFDNLRSVVREEAERNPEFAAAIKS